MARHDPRFASLLDRFVCVRLVQCWGLDRRVFSFDPNLTLVVFFMNADGAVYGRFGTRDARRGDRHVTARGLVQAMKGALELHARWPQNRQALVAKWERRLRWQRPEQIPALRGRVAPVAQDRHSCFHCHFIQGGEILSKRRAGIPVEDRDLWCYPMPELLGFSLDPTQRARVRHVRPESVAAEAGLQPGDDILLLDGQPLLSIADVQWVLHHAQDGDVLPMVVRRGGKQHQLALPLPHRWRRKGELSWRAITWMLRAEVLGFHAEPLGPKARAHLGLKPHQTAYRITRVAPAWNKHANPAARKAGLHRGDVLLAVDGRRLPPTLSEFLAWIAQRTKPGQEVTLDLLRGDRRLRVRLRLR